MTEWPKSWRVNSYCGYLAKGLKPPQGRRWYHIQNQGSTAEILLYDDIGIGGTTAAEFARELGALKASEITLRISSGGGDVFDGIAIYEAVRRHPARVTVQVDALAASAASYIAMAGDRRLVSPHSQFMIHDAAGLCVGNAAEMQAMAALLDRVSNTIAGIYADRVGGTASTWRAAMRRETWYSAEEAVKAGLAHAVDEHADPFEAALARLRGATAAREAIQWNAAVANLLKQGPTVQDAAWNAAVAGLTRPDGRR